MKTTHAKLKTTQNHQLEKWKNFWQYFPLQMFWNLKLTDSTVARFTTLQLSQKGPLQQLMRFQNVVHTLHCKMQFSMQCGFHNLECSVHVVCYSVLCCVQIRSEFTDHSLVWADRSAFCIVAEMHFVQYTAMQCTAHSGRKLPRFPASLAIISISAQSVANPTICLFSNLVCTWQCSALHSAM